MPIDMQCVQCGKLLRVPDSAAGQQARCPACGTVQTVPEVSQPVPEAPGASPFASGPPPRFGDAEANPFQPPQFGGAAAASSGSAALRGPLQPTQIDFGDVFGCTWRIFTNRLGPCMAVFFIGIAVNMPGQIILQVLNTISERNRDGSLILAILFVNILVWLIQTWINIGQVIVLLRVARGQEMVINEMFTGGKYMVRVILATLLVTLIAGLGMILLIVPGIILALMLCQFYCLIIDRDMGIIESLETSRTLMQGNKLTLFAVWLVTVICAPLAILLTCCIGFFFVVPFLSLMMVVIYLLVSGQPMAPEARIQHAQSSFTPNMG